MKKKIRLIDCDKACVISVRDSNIRDDFFSSYRYSINCIESLVEILLKNHVDFTVQYYDSSDPFVESCVSDHSCFVYGLIFPKEGFIYKKEEF